MRDGDTPQSAILVNIFPPRLLPIPPSTQWISNIIRKKMQATPTSYARAQRHTSACSRKTTVWAKGKRMFDVNFRCFSASKTIFFPSPLGATDPIGNCAMLIFLLLDYSFFFLHFRCTCTYKYMQFFHNIYYIATCNVQCFFPRSCHRFTSCYSIHLTSIGFIRYSTIWHNVFFYFLNNSMKIFEIAPDLSNMQRQ